ncbi:MAG TPA: hypothetical protein VGC15_22280, partial [Acetobacteraceae bacterium]
PSCQRQLSFTCDPALNHAKGASSGSMGQISGPTLFRSFFLGGFECSSHRRIDGRRLDLIAASRHDLLAPEDYQQLACHGIRAARDGVRWHRVEGVPGCYDWSPVLPLLRAAEVAGVQVAWDLCHFGWPDHLDVFSAAFVERFARYAAAFARLHLEETGRPPLVCPINEISYLAWAGGEVARMNPGTRGRGAELKRQLVLATLAATLAMRAAAPGTRVLAIDPVIHVVPGQGKGPRQAAAQTCAQFEAWDMLAGRRAPELGGGPEMLDVLGANYYWNNQWVHRGRALAPTDPRRKPLSALLAALHARYDRPLFLAETGIEGDKRADWLRSVATEVQAAVHAGVPMEGVCLYPVLSHPGWSNGRMCPNGLFEMQPRHGLRPVYDPLAAELRQQQALFEALFQNGEELCLLVSGGLQS